MDVRSCASPSQSLSKDKRIRKRREFVHVQRCGVRAFGRFTVVIAKRVHGENGRVGITVPKKVGDAHVRNKIKRRIRHILRTNQDLFFKKSLIVVARESVAKTGFCDLKTDLLDTCKRLNRNRLFLISRGHSSIKKVA